MALGRYKYTPEQLTEAVASSLSVQGVLVYLGVSPDSGGMHFHISRRIKALGLDTSHFRQSRPKRDKRSTDTILCRTPRKPKSALLKSALLQTGREEKCQVCNLGSEWCGRPLKLQIDHIDGDVLNNDPGNLRFICPNCHTQTETYGIRKPVNKPNNVCEVCQIRIHHRTRSGRCRKHRAQVAKRQTRSA